MALTLPMRRMMRIIAVAAVAAIVLLLVLRPKAVAVDILTLAATDVQTGVVASGRVLPPAKVEIGATITARVDRVLVREGARIAADQLLVELERGELAAAAAQARAALARAKARVSSVQTLALPTAQAGLKQAEANLLQAERDDKRNRDLMAKGFISQSRVDEAERQLDIARSQLASARAQAGAQSSSGAEAQQAQIGRASCRERV